MKLSKLLHRIETGTTTYRDVRAVVALVVIVALVAFVLGFFIGGL